MKMKKKYITPAIKVVKIEAASLMEGSLEIGKKTVPIEYVDDVDDVW